MEEKMKSPAFLEQCRELTKKTFEGKVPDEILEKLMSFVPAANALQAGAVPSVSAKVNVTSAFLYGTVECHVSSEGKRFDGKHWGIGLAGFASTGFLYTAYNNWSAFFSEANSYHVQCAGAAGGIVQVNWFNKNGVPVGQYNGIAGGAGAMEVGGSGHWKDE